MSCMPKRIGQNFLIDGNILKKIAAAAELTPTDTVIEVGRDGHTDRNAGPQAGKVIAINWITICKNSENTFFILG